ncbi:unnamed protein product [Caenorhabditis auriculariae]|uniref:Transketolase-like pyrimidine-binding domain-containing protein n=1 Tax=Caenorhabditis auriculariae TaxID=2777116 RepID=A0A8S1GUZ0_9PELO|nr:unnamed protein product [Caenorhabditis auriculariae]
MDSRRVPTYFAFFSTPFALFGLSQKAIRVWNNSQTILIVPELDPTAYGLSLSDDVKSGFSLNDLAEQLRLIYCGPMAVEFMHINNWEERQWLAQRFESSVAEELRQEELLHIGKLMLRCENFDRFLALKFPTLKRYGAEGAESMFGFFSELFETSPEHNIEQVVIGIAHRGRLNLLTQLMQFPVLQMFRKIKGKPEFPNDVSGSGDVLSHLVSSFDYKGKEGQVHVTMLPNPSHLEAVNPVAMGKARARAWSMKQGDYSAEERSARTGDSVLNVLIHGDGAFTGQGIVWESLALSRAPHFRLGGTVHLVTNNQVAFTAESCIGRSTTHCTDIAKAFEYPVIHVNGDHPEELVKATRIALAYREKFRKDIFINLVCFRRWGHNELDDPTFTSPVMYKEIESRESVPRLFMDRLISEGITTEEDIKKDLDKQTEELNVTLKSVDKSQPEVTHLQGNWKGFVQAPSSVERWDTGVDVDLLRFVGAASVHFPDNFDSHKHLQKTHIEARLNKMKSGENIDWATAEALAFGSVLLQGNDVRISGQDVGRGTFCHRHAMFVDQSSDKIHIPLNHIIEGQKNYLEVANNLLSEEAILGFEWGFSSENPRRLCIWEAQFGDFFNGAQIIIDTFIASGESKWLTQSGLTLLLPHGYDGAGPEHSSCRMERFLQMCDSREDQKPVDGEDVNIRIANPTTSAQYFHLLRRQVLPNYRKPLVVVAPKILLRHPKAASSIVDFAPGTFFKNVIDDDACVADKVTKIVFTSGKHWTAVDKAREERNLRETVAVVRLESLCPFPVADLQQVLKKYPKAKEFVWSQEEPRNAGAWPFVSRRFENAVGISLSYAGRPELAWTATAIGEHHAKEVEDVIRQIFP